MQTFRSRVYLLLRSPNFIAERYCNNCQSQFKSLSSAIQTEILKKPIPPPKAKYRFLLAVKPKLLSENPNCSLTEIRALAEKLWRKLNVEEKLPYEMAFKAEAEKYSEALMLYECSLSDDQSASVVLKKARHIRKKPSRELINMLEENGKPKRPPVSAYSIFLKESKGTTFNSKEFRNGIVGLHAMWLNLPQEMKDKYRIKHQEIRENYRKELEEWEKSIGKSFDKWESIQNSVDQNSEIEKLRKPARVPTALSLFIRERRAAEHPKKVGLKQLKGEWKNLSKDLKERYTNEVERLHQKHIQERKIWESEIRRKSADCVQNELISFTRNEKTS